MDERFFYSALVVGLIVSGILIAGCRRAEKGATKVEGSQKV